MQIYSVAVHPYKAILNKPPFSHNRQWQKKLFATVETWSRLKRATKHQSKSCWSSQVRVKFLVCTVYEYDHFYCWCLQKFCSFMIIIWPLGGAGSGKSKVIDVITNWVNYICSGAETGDGGHSTDLPLIVKTAFTGAAADNIGGNTLTKTFGLAYDG